MITLEEFNNLKRKVDQLIRDESKSTGIRESLLKQLKEEGYETLEKAKQAMRQLEKQQQSEQKEFDEMLKEFQTKWEKK
jgi:Arc/MetJ-type ribon-helix-helix transcriptional regulator